MEHWGDWFLPLCHGRIKGALLNPELFLQTKCRLILCLWHVDLGYPCQPAQEAESAFPDPADSMAEIAPELGDPCLDLQTPVSHYLLARGREPPLDSPGSLLKLCLLENPLPSLATWTR